MQDIQITLDRDSRKHLYDQIYTFIADAVRRGELQQGERLPSTRILAANLDVSRSTVQIAYDQLLAEGYIVSKRGSGYYVGMIGAQDFIRTGRPAEGAYRGTGGKMQLCPDGREGAKGPAPAKESEEIDFSPRLIEMGQFPYATWKRIHKGIFADARKERADLFASGDAAGDLPLREVIAHYLHLSRGVRCTPEQVIVGAGNDYLLLLLGQILGRDIRVAMESPTYLRAGRIFRSMGWDVRSVAMDGEGMRADLLERADCSAAYVMPAHQFPVGTLMPVSRRARLLAWAYSVSGRYLIEDDYDSEFRYRGKPVPSLQSLDSEGRVIYIGTFSKSIAPAIRVSYMILPEALADRYRENCSFFSNTVSRIDQAILREFMSEGYFERYLNRMRTLYRGRHDVLLQELRALEAGFVLRGAGAGLHICLLEKGFTGSRDEAARREEELRQAAEEAGVRIYTASEFLLPWDPWPEGQPAVPGLILGYGALPAERIREGIRKLFEIRAFHLK